MSRRTLLLAALALVAALVGAVWAHPAALTAVDVEQSRLNVAAPLPQGSAVVTQTFVAQHAGLSSIELLAVVYPPDEGVTAPSPTFTLELRDAALRLVAAQTFTSLAHNALVPLSFTPEAQSAGQTYTLTLSAPAGNRTTVWAYGLDGYAAGVLNLAGAPQPGDLRFTTRYTYQWAAVVADSAAALRTLLGVALPAWLVLFAPGLLIVGGLRATSASPWQTPAARWGAALAFSLAFGALLWVWIGVFGLRWSPLSLWLVYGLLGLAAAGRWLWAVWYAPAGWATLRPSAHTVTLLVLLTVGLLARFLAARDLALPPWVDSSHHYAIARVLELAGNTPAGYAPLLPVARLSYHIGFHALAVTLHWLTGQPLVDTFMWFGQLLQGLLPLAAYAAVCALTGRARAGWLAAAFAALLSYFPGYYLTWGRFTQLTGLVLLFPALALAWRVAAGLPSRRGLVINAVQLGLLAAGLFVTHYAVFMLWVAAVAVMAILPLRRALLPLALSGVAGALLAAPWLLRLGTAVARSPTGVDFAAPAGYNAFPWEYFSSPLERAWLGLAAVLVLWGLLRRAPLMWLMALWGALVAIIVNVGNGNWLVTNNTLAITLCVPGAIILGWGADRWLSAAHRWFKPPAPAEAAVPPVPAAPPAPAASRLARLRPLLSVLMVLLLAGTLGYGAATGLAAQVGILNPATILATPADRAALAWVDANVPANAVFVINSWEWLNGIWAGSDGGAWLWPLTSRATTLPPVDYMYGDPAWQAQITAFNRQLRDVTDAEAPATLALFEAAGVTHVFIGARGGTLQPEWFVNQPHYQLLFTNGADWVFAFTAQ